MLPPDSKNDSENKKALIKNPTLVEELSERSIYVTPDGGLKIDISSFKGFLFTALFNNL